MPYTIPTPASSRQRQPAGNPLVAAAPDPPLKKNSQVLCAAVSVDETGHVVADASHARMFCFFYVDGEFGPVRSELVTLPRWQIVHLLGEHECHPLDDADVVITGSCSRDFLHRMLHRHIAVVITCETDPLRAVRQHMRDRSGIAY